MGGEMGSPREAWLRSCSSHHPPRGGAKGAPGVAVGRGAAETRARSWRGVARPGGEGRQAGAPKARQAKPSRAEPAREPSRAPAPSGRGDWRRGDPAEPSQPRRRGQPAGASASGRSEEPLRPMGAPRSPGAFGSLLCCLLSVVLAQRVKVQDEVTGYVGQEVTLPCRFTSTSSDIKVSQVTWVKETGMKKQSVAVYHPELGPSYPTERGSGRIRFRAQSLQDATLIIGPLQMSDEGTYTCEFATYPLGNEDGLTQLIILAKPTNFAEALEVKAGNTEVPVATCVSANGKPAAHITWQSYLNGNFTTSTVTNANGTVTVSSQYVMVPTKEANDQRIFCHVEQKALAQPESILVTLSILYPPEVVIEGYDDNWYLSREEAVLTCSATGNPPPTNLSWTTSSGPLPKSVAVKGDKLVVRNVDATVNTTFFCHAINRVGRVSTEQIILVRDQPAKRQSGSAGALAGAIVGGILALALLGALVAFFVLRRRRRATKGAYDPKTRVFGNGTAPPPVRTFAELDRPLKAAPGRGREEEEEEEEEEMRKERRLPYGYPPHRLEDEEEQFDQLGPMLRLDSSPCGYEYDDMESQHDGSIISKTAVYV